MNRFRKFFRCGIAALLCLLLAGCGSTYVEITPSSRRTSGYTAGDAPAENAEQLYESLEAMITSGVDRAVLYAVNMNAEELDATLTDAVQRIRKEVPIAAYAVQDVDFEVGTTGGKLAAAVNVTYRRSAVEIRRILRVENMDQVREIIRENIEDATARVVMEVGDYQNLDAAQLVHTLAETRPDVVMEEPSVAQEVFGSGQAKVIELSFAYRNSREALMQMREQVQPVFDSAALYVSGDGAMGQKYSQLCSFLMERFEYTIGTSITPSYSLLRHGVGDSRAFATVYAAMCRQAGLECMVVNGTRSGQPWSWNMVCDEGSFFHVDLLREGDYAELSDEDLTGYVWDYSAYPACVAEE